MIFTAWKNGNPTGVWNLIQASATVIRVTRRRTPFKFQYKLHGEVLETFFIFYFFFILTNNRLNSSKKVTKERKATKKQKKETRTRNKKNSHISTERRAAG